MSKKFLDLGKMSRFYDFGGLYYYSVHFIDKISKKDIIERNTFDVKCATTKLKELQKQKIDCWIESHLV